MESRSLAPFRVFCVTGQIGVELITMAYLCVGGFLYIVTTGVGLLACPSSVVVYLSVSNEVFLCSYWSMKGDP